MGNESGSSRAPAPAEGRAPQRALGAPGVVLSILFLVAGARARAADPPPGGSQFGEAIEVRVVSLEVEVSDSAGNPVTGLSAADLELSVDGIRVPIEYFTEIRGGVAAGPTSPTAGVGDPSAPVEGAKVDASYLVFVDDFFPLARDRDRALEALRDDLGQLRPEDRMAIVAFDGKDLAMLSSWTTSVPELERALRRAQARPAHGSERLVERGTLASDRETSRRIVPNTRGVILSGMEEELDVPGARYARLLELQVEALVSAVAETLRGFADPPGRKLLLMVSGGWPQAPGELAAREVARTSPVLRPASGETSLAPLIDTAQQVGYTIFAIDAASTSSDAGVPVGVGVAPTQAERGAAYLGDRNRRSALEVLARPTGGAVLGGGRRDSPLEAATRAAGFYYSIGFPATMSQDDSRHEIRVRPVDGDLTVRSRAGYVDFSPAHRARASIESVLSFGGGAGALTLPLEVGTPVATSRRTMRVPIELRIPAAQLTFLPSSQGEVVGLELRFAADDAQGARSEIPTIPIRWVLPPGSPRPQVIRYKTQLELRRSPNRVVIALFDPVAGTIWSTVTEIRP